MLHDGRRSVVDNRSFGDDIILARKYRPGKESRRVSVMWFSIAAGNDRLLVFSNLVSRSICRVMLLVDETYKYAIIVVADVNDF